jgi:hypothetical protein
MYVLNVLLIAIIVIQISNVIHVNRVIINKLIQLVFLNVELINIQDILIA